MNGAKIGQQQIWGSRNNQIILEMTS